MRRARDPNPGNGQHAHTASIRAFRHGDPVCDSFAVAKSYHRAKKYVNRVVRKVAENIHFLREGSGIQKLPRYIWS